MREAIIRAANQTIIRKGGIKRQKLVPWWNDKCSEVIRKCNKAFKVLKNTNNFQHFIGCKRMQAVERLLKKRKENIGKHFVFYNRKKHNNESSLGNVKENGRVE